MASNLLKNISFGGPTYFDRQWATCLGSRQEGAELGWPSSRLGKREALRLKKMAHVYVNRRYILNAFLIQSR